MIDLLGHLAFISGFSPSEGCLPVLQVERGSENPFLETESSFNPKTEQPQLHHTTPQNPFKPQALKSGQALHT